jgi:hypothetical protein
MSNRNVSFSVHSDAVAQSYFTKIENIKKESVSKPKKDNNVRNSQPSQTIEPTYSSFVDNL